MGLVKHILLHNFWSFLLVISGIIDIALGIVSYFIGTPATKTSQFTTLAICSIIGFIYISIGIALAVFKIKKQGIPKN